ncbi:hypothetical protein KBA27_03170 [bacterium]|nr:hypothetical protein [bacterium]
MKKLLTTALILSFAMGLGSQVFADTTTTAGTTTTTTTTTTTEDDTFTGALLERLHKKIDKTASPIVNKEKAYNAQQKAWKENNEKQVAAQKKAYEERQKAQQEAINKKKEQVQKQKSLWQEQKNMLKNLFSVN